MRTIFVGDIHGCAEEFQEILSTSGYRKGTDRLLLTGDAFSKGPDPFGIWRLILETGAQMVVGNHDAELVELIAGTREPDEGQATTLAQIDEVKEELSLWLEVQSLYIREMDFILVHAGIHPEKGLDRTRREEFLAIRTWPPTDGIEGPRWHDHFEPIDGKVVVFGHDAPGGLVHKKRPKSDTTYLVGLDTGCVYGGALTAYILEQDDFVQVESKQA
tara:strand:- start:7353 stop:8003 length:651 start_codon:yes stop_codon:yes gene_type:complete